MSAAIPWSGYGSSPALCPGEALPGRLPTDSPLRGCALSRSGHMASAPLGSCFEGGRLPRRIRGKVVGLEHWAGVLARGKWFMSGVLWSIARRWLFCEPLRVEGGLVGIDRPCGSRDAAREDDQRRRLG